MWIWPEAATVGVLQKKMFLEISFFDCILHDLLIAKLASYGFDSNRK